MKAFTLPLAALVVLAVTGVTSAVSSADGHCNGEATSYKLKIRVVGNKPVEVLNGNSNANDLHVCLGDTIEWKLQGDARKFYLRFGEGAPFSGDHHPRSHNGKIEVTIDHGEPDDAFKYDIGIEGGEIFDPRIIIDD